MNMQINYLLLLSLVMATTLVVSASVYAEGMSASINVSVNTSGGVEIEQHTGNHAVDQQIQMQNNLNTSNGKNESRYIERLRKRERNALEHARILRRKFRMHKIMTIGNETKKIQISTPRGEITITKEFNDDESKRAMVEIEKNFENSDEVEKFTINPKRARIAAFLRRNNMTNITELPKGLKLRLRAMIRNRKVNISLDRNDSKVKIISGNITVVTKKEIEVDNGTVYVVVKKNVRKQLKVLPEEASEVAKLKVNYHLVKTVEINVDNDRAVYRVKGTQRGKLLGLFETQVDADTDVDVETGNVVAVRKPWWSFLVF